MLQPDLPASVLPTVLRAAVDAGFVLPAGFVAGFLDNDDPAVRGAAFDLARGTKVPSPRLREGLFDREAPIRRAAAIALAQRGDAAGRDVLLAELAHTPSAETIEALGAIGDDDAIVGLGRCAMRRPDFAAFVIAVLRDLRDPRADRLAARLESEPPGSGSSGA